LHRIDAAFFRVGESRGGLLVKFYAGEEHSEEELLADLERNGFRAGRLEREGRLLMRPEKEPWTARHAASNSGGSSRRRAARGARCGPPSTG
jgi:hypothetical protein